MHRTQVAALLLWSFASSPLWAQDGTPSFSNRAAEAGVEFLHTNPTFFNKADYTGGGTVGDFDREGTIDLFAVSGGAGLDHLFINDGDGTFTDSAAAWGMTTVHLAKAATSGDYNDDGLFDWYVCSIYWPAANWTGNKLYLNTPGGNLEEVSELAGVEDGGYGWGAVSVDFDHDGLLDIAETNGDNATPMFINEQSYVFMNEGNGSFTESAIALGLQHSAAGRGMVNFDYDDDGDQDVAIFTNFGTFTLWNNDLGGTEIAWLRVFLDTTANDELAADGYGTVISATVGSSTQYRHVFGGDNYLSCSELSAHFGLGAATSLDELRVEWSNGEVTVLNDVAVNQALTVTPPEDDHWTRVGLGTGGDHGVPQIRGKGDLVGGNPATLSLTNGKPSTLFYVVLSANELSVPFEGGVLVPAPDIIRLFATDAAGAWAATVPWPLGVPSDTTIWFQAWQQDATGVVGWISSNGLRATTP